jgi:hypothetical protein
MVGASDHRTDSYPLPAIEGSRVAEQKANPVRDKGFAFALAVFKVHRAPVRIHEYEILKQLMRSATAIGAIVEAAVGAESRKGFSSQVIPNRKPGGTRPWGAGGNS